jgi:hypothetical protein
MTAGYSKRTPHKMTGDQRMPHCRRSSDETVIFDSCTRPTAFPAGRFSRCSRRAVLFGARHPRRQSGLAGQEHRNRRVRGIHWPRDRLCVEEHKCNFQHVARTRDPTAAEIFAGLPNLGLQKVIDIVADRFCRDEIAQCGLPYANSLGKQSKPAATAGSSCRPSKPLEYHWKGFDSVYREFVAFASHSGTIRACL